MEKEMKEERALGIREFQQMVDGWIRSTKAGYYDELTNMAILAEETGEVARIIARGFGRQRCKATDEVSRDKLGEELADVVRVCFALASQTGIDMEKALLDKHRRILERDKDM